MSHFDEMTSLLYLEGQLERPRALEVSAHAEACADCRALLRALELESGLLERALVEEDESVPARLLAPPAREAVPWAWIVGFGFAAAGAYAFWTGVVEPWQQQLSQAGLGGSNLLTMLFFGGVLWKGWGAVMNTVEYVAMATLGLLAVGLLRRRWRRWTMVAVVMGVVVAALALTPPAGAAEFRTHAHVFTLGSNEVVKNDLVVSAETARIDGTVEGDLIFFGRSVTLNGHVTGDVIAFGQFVRINGAVDGNVRTFCQILSLSAPVGKNVTSFVQTLEFDPKSQVGGGMMLFVRDATLEGRVGRDLTGFIRRVVLNGTVGGNALLRAARLTIGPSAEIDGKATYNGEGQPEVSPQAKLASPLEIHIVHHRPSYASPRFYLRLALLWAVAFLFGLLIALLVPGFFADVVRSTGRSALSFGIGAITLVACVILAVIAVLLLLIGLAGGVVVLLLFAPALYSAQVFVGTWLGEKFLGPSTDTGGVLGRLALGLLVVRVVWLIPYLGWIIWLAVQLLGLGALTLTLYKTARPQVAIAA